MGWRGTIRSVGAAVRRAEREAKRQQRELERHEKASAKQLDQQVAASEVALYEEFVNRLVSIHIDLGEPIDWRELRDRPESRKPVMERLHENEAQSLLDSYKPSLFDRIFGKQEGKVTGLEVEVASGKNRDTYNFEKAIRRYEEEQRAWGEKRELATQVLECAPSACMAVLEELAPFQEISEIGSHLRLSINEEDTAVISVELDVHGKGIVPEEKKYLLKGGKLSTKPLPKGEFYALYQDYVCSCCLRIASEIFAVLPMAVVIVTAKDQILNTKSGHMEKLPIFSAAIPRSTFEGLNLVGVDPSDAMDNFLHNMKFMKTKGFKPIAAITYEDLPAALKQMGPQMLNAEWMETVFADIRDHRASHSVVGPAWEIEARELLDSGKKIHAIKLVRESTAMPLKDAKELVESWET
jgi:hypothetical protein